MRKIKGREIDAVIIGSLCGESNAEIGKRIGVNRNVVSLARGTDEYKELLQRCKALLQAYLDGIAQYRD